MRLIMHLGLDIRGGLSTSDCLINVIWILVLHYSQLHILGSICLLVSYNSRGYSPNSPELHWFIYSKFRILQSRVDTGKVQEFHADSPHFLFVWSKLEEHSLFTISYHHGANQGAKVSIFTKDCQGHPLSRLIMSQESIKPSPCGLIRIKKTVLLEPLLPAVTATRIIMYAARQLAS